MVVRAAFQASSLKQGRLNPKCVEILRILLRWYMEIFGRMV